MKRSTPEQAREWRARSKPLKRGGPLKRSAAKPRRKLISPASAAQRAKVREAPCIVCRGGLVKCDPAHLIDRSIGGTDDARAVVPLCRGCHREFDEGSLDLLPHLEPHHRAELAYAVETVGLMRTLQRVTNRKWEPVEPPHNREGAKR